SHVRDFASAIVMATHPQWERAPEVARRFVRYGASPRGAQALVLGAKVRALAEGRYNVSIEDIKAMTAPALRHRVILNFEGEAEGGLVLVGALAGLVYGAARRIDRLDTARVADRAFGLHDRVATTLEWAERADRTPLVEALVADTRARVEALQMKRVVRHELPG